MAASGSDPKKGTNKDADAAARILHDLDQQDKEEKATAVAHPHATTAALMQQGVAAAARVQASAAGEDPKQRLEKRVLQEIEDAARTVQIMQIGGGAVRRAATLSDLKAGKERILLDYLDQAVTAIDTQKLDQLGDHKDSFENTLHALIVLRKGQAPERQLLFPEEYHTVETSETESNKYSSGRNLLDFFLAHATKHLSDATIGDYQRMVSAFVAEGFGKQLQQKVTVLAQQEGLPARLIEMIARIDKPLDNEKHSVVRLDASAAEDDIISMESSGSKSKKLCDFNKADLRLHMLSQENGQAIKKAQYRILADTRYEKDYVEPNFAMLQMQRLQEKHEFSEPGITTRKVWISELKKLNSPEEVDAWYAKEIAAADKRQAEKTGQSVENRGGGAAGPHK